MTCGMHADWWWSVRAGAEGAWPAVLDELLARVLHCCYSDTWPTRCGGLASLAFLTSKCGLLACQNGLQECPQLCCGHVQHLGSPQGCTPNSSGVSRLELGCAHPCKACT